MASASAAGPLATSYVETLIIDAKMFENYALEGSSEALGSGLACLVGDFGARTSPKESKTGNLICFLGSLGSTLRPKMAEVATKIAILASFWELA